MRIVQAAGRSRRGTLVAATLVLALGGSAVLAAAAGSIVFRVTPRSVISSPQAGFGETAAAIHPLTPRRLLAASIQRTAPDTRVSVASSVDGGRTWRSGLLPLSAGDTSHFDPYVAWTTDGKAWAAVIAATAEGSRFRVFRSADNGVTWVLDGTPSAAQTADRSTLWADNSASSPYRGTLYASWHFLGIPYLSRRPPGGTWSAPLKLSRAETIGNAQGGDVRTDPAGTVYTFWPDNGAPAPASNNIYVARSTNGGKTFGKPVKAAAMRAGFSFVVAPSFISTRIAVPAADRRGTAKLAYVIWMDAAGGQPCEDAISGGLLFLSESSACEQRIWFSRSTDGGAHWSAPASLFDPADANDQFNPALAVDATTGNLFATYHDTTGDPARVQTNLWMQMSKDRGATWSAPVRLTNPSSPRVWYGDYEGLAAGRGIVLPVWTSGNGAFPETWTAVVAPQP
jgi:BNR repeat-like domain